MWIWIGLGVSMMVGFVFYCCIVVGARSDFDWEKMQQEREMTAPIGNDGMVESCVTGKTEGEVVSGTEWKSYSEISDRE